MMIDRIKTEPWANSKWGVLRYYSENILIRFDEMDEGCMHHLVAPSERTIENYPIIAEGIVAYVVASDINDCLDLYQRYFEYQKQEYVDFERKKANAFKRDLNTEFLARYPVEEKARILRSSNIYTFYPKERNEEIKQYVDGYMEFVDNMLPESAKGNKSSTFSLAFIALVCIYKKINIEPSNALAILNEYGHDSTEPRKLLEKYNGYQKVGDRQNLSGMHRSDLERLKLLKRVIKYLQSTGIDPKIAIEDCKSLEEKIKQ